MSLRLPVNLISLAVLVASGLAFGLGGCDRSEPTPTARTSPEMWTGVTIPKERLPGFNGSESYAVIRRSALDEIRIISRSRLNRDGLVGYDVRFDCNAIVDHYLTTAQTIIATDAWHSRLNAEAFALAAVWYWPDNSKRPHAIVQAETEDGTVYYDPQNGNEVKMTESELRSVYLRKW